MLPIDHPRSAREMAQAGRDVGKLVLARALRLALDEQVFVRRDKTIIFD